MFLILTNSNLFHHLCNHNLNNLKICTTTSFSFTKLTYPIFSFYPSLLLFSFHIASFSPTMASPADKNDVSASLSQLSIDAIKPTKKQKSKKVVADSWEDEDDSDVEAEKATESSDTTTTTTTTNPVPSPPPPTPASPGAAGTWPSTLDSVASPSSRYSADPDKRPEKTDAVARRMIAAGLGLKAPKQTDEQRAYQKSVREQEKKKREQQKAEEKKQLEEAEKAKAAIWDD